MVVKRRNALDAQASKIDKGKGFFAGPDPAQLVPSNTMYHPIPYISRFMENFSDDFAREFGEYFK